VYTPGKSSIPLPLSLHLLSIIGSLHQAPKSHPKLQYHACGKAYGPVVYLDLNRQSIIIPFTSKVAHHLLAKQDTIFSDCHAIL